MSPNILKASNRPHGSHGTPTLGTNPRLFTDTRVAPWSVLSNSKANRHVDPRTPPLVRRYSGVLDRRTDKARRKRGKGNSTSTSTPSQGQRRAFLAITVIRGVLSDGLALNYRARTGNMDALVAIVPSNPKVWSG